MQENQEIILSEEDVDASAAELCRREFSFFVKEFWDVIIEDDLEWNWHMDVLCDEIQAVYERVFLREPKLYDLIINIPPGTSKSTICTVMAPVWSWTRDPSLRHITGSYSDSLATEHAVKSRDIIRSDKFKRYFPEILIKKDEDNKTNYKTTKNGQRFTTSVGGTVTGVHAHITTIDDPINPKQAASKVELEGSNAWADRTLSTRKVDKRVSATILIMQRLAVGDLTGHWLEKKGNLIRHVCLPGKLGKNVKPIEYRSKYLNGFLDTNRLNQKVLDELLIDLGSAGYAGQIDQNPVPEGGLIWKEWLIPIPDENFPAIKFLQSYGSDWDLAYTKDEDNAASAFVTAGKLRHDIYIDAIGWDWLEFPGLIAFMKRTAGPHYIEPKASGKSAKQTLVKSGINAIEIAVAGGSDKVARARMATPIAQAGRVYIRKSIIDRLYNDPNQGILFFPRGKFKDLADALAQSLLRLNKSEIVSSNGSDDVDILDELWK